MAETASQREEAREEAVLTKRCATCRLEFPTTMFCRNRSRSDGLSPRCTACRKVERAAPRAQELQRQRHAKTRALNRARYSNSQIGESKQQGAPTALQKLMRQALLQKRAIRVFQQSIEEVKACHSIDSTARLAQQLAALIAGVPLRRFKESHAQLIGEQLDDLRNAIELAVSESPADNPEKEN